MAARSSCRRPSSSCSSTCCATTDRCSRASRSSAPCGDTSTIPRPTSWTSTSAICAASSAARGPGADLHGALGRLPPRQPQLIDAEVSLPLLLTRAALAPGGMGHAGHAGLPVITFVAVYRGTGSQLRHQIDQEIAGDAREFAHTLAFPRSAIARAGALPSDGATPHPRGNQVRRKLDVAARDRAGQQHCSPTVPDRSAARAHVDNERGLGEQTQGELASPEPCPEGSGTGYSTLTMPDVGELRFRGRVTVVVPGGHAF